VGGQVAERYIHVSAARLLAADALLSFPRSNLQRGQRHDISAAVLHREGFARRL